MSNYSKLKIYLVELAATKTEAVKAAV